MINFEIFNLNIIELKNHYSNTALEMRKICNMSQNPARRLTLSPNDQTSLIFIESLYSNIIINNLHIHQVNYASIVGYLIDCS
jgi:hypothetical protein